MSNRRMSPSLVEKVPRDGARLGAEVVVGVVGLADAAEEDGDDAGQVEDLAEEEGGVGHEDEQGRLQLGVIPGQLVIDHVIFQGIQNQMIYRVTIQVW